ncbi:MAG: hypothetical protein ACON34_05340 [Flavobacteriales bacterium]
MIDGIKLSLPRTLAQSLMNRSDLDFRSPYLPTKAFHRGLCYEVKRENYVLVKGSIHKYARYGEHNHDDFDLTELRDSIRELCSFLSIQPEDAALHNIEIGVNLSPPVATDLVLDGLLCHRTQRFIRAGVKNGHVCQARHAQYVVKAYNKARQFDLAEEIMRFELKVLKMQKVASLGINTLADLLIKDKVIEFGKMLQTTWDHIIFIARHEKSLLEGHLLGRWSELREPEYWIGLSKGQRYTRKLILEQFNLSPHSTHGMISEMIASKRKVLLN